MVKGEYCLQINTAFQNYCGEEIVEIGKVTNLQSGKVAFLILYDKKLYSNAGYHMCMSVGNESMPVVLVDDKDRECMYVKQDIFFALIMHEYGHYINGDLNRTNISSQQIREDRLQCVKLGKVQEMELNADSFAVNCVGKIRL